MAGTDTVDSTSEWFPVHLRGAAIYQAPDALVEFARDYGALTVAFVDDTARCDRSFRRQKDIFVNTRATFWDSVIIGPWLCRSPAEAILLRFLHELGHISLGHPGDSSIASTPSGLTIQKPANLWAAFAGTEGDAWLFALRLRDSHPVRYSSLLQSVTRWYQSHSYSGKDWAESPKAQWEAKAGSPFPDDLWQFTPKWVMERLAR